MTNTRSDENGQKVPQEKMRPQKILDELKEPVYPHPVYTSALLGRRYDGIVRRVIKPLLRFFSHSVSQREKGGNSTGAATPSMLMVRPARFERATYGFEVRCSIQLSYGRINDKTIAALIRQWSLLSMG